MKKDIINLHEQFCQERLILNYRDSTVRWYQKALKQFLSFNNGYIRFIEDVETDLLQRYLYEKSKSGWQADTYINQYNALKSFFKWCVKKGYINQNPIEPIEKPKLEAKLPKRISKQDAIRVLDHSFNGKVTYRFERYRNRAILAIMLYGGLRAQEVLNLKLANVDLLNCRISVLLGKGGKDRVVPISPTLKRLLYEYLKDRSRLGKQSDYFFTSLQGSKPFTYSGMRRVVGKIEKGTGIRFSSHRLRHTFATLMLEGGCDLFSLQQMMGHSNIKTTTIYLSTSDNMLQKQIMKHPLG